MLATLPSTASAWTQIFDSAILSSLVSWCARAVRSEDLEAVEELDDLLVGLAVVLDDLTGLALRGGADVDDLLPGAGPADDGGVDAEVGDLHLVDRLRLG